MDWKYFLGGLGLFLIAYFLYRAIEGLRLSNRTAVKSFVAREYVATWAFIILCVVMGVSAIVMSFGINI
ncbi:hypothetical protein [Pedobacter sp. FW305-3-2-15-E-R2A2]|uniref:hypothetical protein n=1 Tax=Pedobacter sp. FW305-3-2-15-E-R2A2 TaxID=3140251 RepID=UPI00313FE65F